MEKFLTKSGMKRVCGWQYVALLHSCLLSLSFFLLPMSSLLLAVRTLAILVLFEASVLLCGSGLWIFFSLLFPRIHGLKSGKTLKEFRGHTSFVNEVVFTPDGHSLLRSVLDPIMPLTKKSTHCTTPDSLGQIYLFISYFYFPPHSTTTTALSHHWFAFLHFHSYLPSLLFSTVDAPLFPCGDQWNTFLSNVSIVLWLLPCCVNTVF